MDAAAQRLHDVRGDEDGVLGVVAGPDDHLVHVDGGEARQVNALGLDQLEQQRQQLAAALEYLGPVQDAPGGPDDLPFEIVRVGVVGRTPLPQHREVDVADEVRDVFAAQVGGGVLGDPDLVACGDVDTYDWDRTPRPGAREQPVADRTGDGLFMPEDPVLLAP